jgi:hypothetical protein
MALSGERVVAMQTTFSRNLTDGNTGSTGYIVALTTAGTCGVAFVAPPSGKVTVLFGTASYNGNANVDNKTAIRVGTSSTVGGGTEVYAATDNDMILTNVGANIATRQSGFAEISGLTAGNTYNACMAHRVSAGTGHWLFRSIKVIPDV